jgi:hypothetical protein
MPASFWGRKVLGIAMPTFALVAGVALGVGLLVGCCGGFLAGRYARSTAGPLFAWREEQRRNAYIKFDGRPLSQWAEDLAKRARGRGSLRRGRGHDVSAETTGVP